jgi:hypothetical protein
MSRKARKHAVIIARRAIRAIPRDARDVEEPVYRAEHAAFIARKEFRAMKAAYLWGKGANARMRVGDG